MNKRNDLPEILKPIYFDFHWSQKKLWQLNIVPSSLEIKDLVWAFNYPIWASDFPKKKFDLRPNDVLFNLEKYQKHKVKIEIADTSCPIHVLLWKERLLIIDGFHRVCKLIIAGEKIVKAKVLSEHDVVKIQPDDEYKSGY